MAESNTSIEQVIGRLERVERQNRLLKFVALAGLVAIAMGAAASKFAAHRDENAPRADKLTKGKGDWIKAQTFTIHDQEQRPRGMFHSWGLPDGEGSFCLFAKNGEGQIALEERWYGNGPTLGIGYSPRIRMWAPPEGAGPQMMFRGNDNSDRVWLSSRDDGAALTLHDGSGRARLRLVADGKGGRVEFLDAGGNVVSKVGSP